MVKKIIENFGKYRRNILENTILDIVLYRYFRYFFTVFFGICGFLGSILQYLCFILKTIVSQYFPVFLDFRNFIQ